MSQPTYLAPGTVLQNRYEIRREIGRGGYSIVYLAQDRRIAAPVAIKLLVPPPVAARLARERMRREVQSVRGIADPAIVTVYDFADDGPWSFIVMEYVPGPDVSIRVRDEGPLSIAEVVSVGRDVAGALGAAHRKGVLHRDVKPQNILLDPRGRGRLTDFGSARLADQTTLTGTGGLIGTPEFAAPEVFAGQRGDARSDIYGLGLSLYFALTGELPRRSSPHAPPTAVADGHHPKARRDDVPVWLDSVIARATAADPDDRFSGAAAFASALAAGDTATGLEPVLPHVDSCLACAGPDPLGLGICPRCTGSGTESGDTLIFARSTPTKAVAAMLGNSVRGLEARDAAEGARPLVLVPAAAAGQVLDRLADRGIAARAVPRRRAWTAAPVGNYVLALAVLAAGAGAGSAIGAALFWPAPFLAVLLTASAVQAARRPVAGAAGVRNRGVRLPSALRERVVATLAELPPGVARNLLSRLVRRASVLLSGPPSSAPATTVATGIESMVVAACGAALELMRLEQAGTALAEKEGDAQARCDAARDVLVQRLLDADAALGRVQAGTAGSASADLGALTEQLEAEARIQAGAAAEVERLLQGAR